MFISEVLLKENWIAFFRFINFFFIVLLKNEEGLIAFVFLSNNLLQRGAPNNDIANLLFLG